MSTRRQERAFDDNGAGVIDYRAWLYETHAMRHLREARSEVASALAKMRQREEDEDALDEARNELYSARAEEKKWLEVVGRYRSWEWLEYQDQTVPNRETKSHALSHPVRDDGRASIAEEIVRLDPNERAAWELSVMGFKFKKRVITGVAVGNLEAMRRKGYTPIEKSKHTVERNGHLVEVWDVEGEQPERLGLSTSEIAERLSQQRGEAISMGQARRWLASARAKLAGTQKPLQKQIGMHHGARCRCRGCADERRSAEVDAVIPQAWKEPAG